MRDVPYQAMLFEEGEDEPFTHFFYATTNSITVKVGMAGQPGKLDQPVEKRMKRDGQFKGHILIRAIPCNCTPRIVMSRKKCQREIDWENAHAADRLPASEQYRPSADVYTALRFMAGRDRVAMAALDWLRRHGMPKVS